MMCIDVMTNNQDGLLCCSRSATATTTPMTRDRVPTCAQTLLVASSSRQQKQIERIGSGQQMDQYDGGRCKQLDDRYSRKTTGPDKTSSRLREFVGLELESSTKSMRDETEVESSKQRSAIKLAAMVDDICISSSSSTRQGPQSRTKELLGKKRTIIAKMCHQTRGMRSWLVPLLVMVSLTTRATASIDGRQRMDLATLEDRLLAVGNDFTPMRRPQFRQQQQQQQPAEAKQAAGSSSKFTRMNELDVFLDDMNHNELRAVATGKPINDYLFQARPLAGAASGQPAAAAAAAAGAAQHERLRNLNHQAAGQVLPSASSNSSNSVGGGSTHLDESQSEQQIYSECALILQRTYVKNIDNPKHELVPFGKTEQACISYKHIDKAVEQAKHLLKFKELTKRRKKQKPKLPALDIIHKTLEPPQDLIAALGELNMATTQILANQFDLSNDELLNGLPLIDMSKTKFWPLCPALVKQDIKCELSRFRTLTGHCNNLKHPTWGAAMTPFARYLPPVHPDGIWIPRKSIVTETVFDISPGPRSMHDQQASQPRAVIGDPLLASPMMPPHPPPPPPPVPSMEHLSSSASVQFASHARPEEAELASLMQMQGSPYGPLLLPPPPSQPPVTTYHRLGETAPPSAINARQLQNTAVASLDSSPPAIHFQESHSPDTLYSAGAFPLRAAGQQTKLLTSESAHHGGHQARPVALELPSARLVTSVVHRDIDLPNHDLSILFMSWGQLLDHDMSRAAQSPPSIKCCTEDGKPKHKLCLPIQVPHDDPFYSKHNVQCLEFRRTLAGLRPNCVLGPRVHQNAITSPIDANFVYGSSQQQSDSLRLFRGGRLRDRDWFKAERLKPLLPAQDVDPDAECIARPKDLFCFLAGDVRVNEQTHLTVLHTIYMREHNRIVDQLAELNPHWDDERLFQEARHIVAAGVQHVMVNEYLPLLVGKKMADLYNLTAVSAHHDPKSAGLHWHGYEPTVTTSVSNSFAAAAFRQGHTFIQSSFERYNKFHEFVASERLRHLFKRPFLLYQPGVMDELVAGMINQASQSYDPFISEDISGHLFQPPELAFGHDLAAINLQRGREQGLPGYNLFREWCGLPRAETFDQLEPYLTNHTAFHYSRLYRHVDDIDLWSGGISERKLPGAAIGPTFACIIARQFSNTRRGDRFWYENPGLPSSFSSRQLVELRKVSLARILCANSDDLPTFQRWALRMAHPVLNPRVPCDQLPQMDLRAWQEE